MKHKISHVVTLALGAAAGTSNGWQLASYDVPLALTVSSAFAVFACVHLGAEHLACLLSGTTYRCTEPGCAFRVRVTGVNAAENRRWQETAAAHPTHRLVRP
ncbi:hypothetical protein [Streptomyces huiliensis]|uniref:hypothetical protein n=1 Tax=Streptomyces huiliensis TaxID=2876027 RepID=UPI001CBBA9A0|nr:hypothetical protein [Streptomyces huiliensis]MBZ4319400.1 hypothetical protein [Streptomyces huiliensis]